MGSRVNSLRPDGGCTRPSPAGRFGLAFGLAAGLALTWALPARPVVIATGDGTGNTAAPPDDPGWAQIAMVGNLTGYYLGNGWVLTANHVGERDVVIDGVPYPVVVGSLVQFETSPGVPADLAVMQIEGDPGLPEPPLASRPPAVGEEALMIGFGRSRAPTRSYWNAGWQPVGPGAAVYTGFEDSAPQTLRWGMNFIHDVGVDVSIGGTTTRSFVSTWSDDNTALVDEAQAVVGDSGGPVFVKRAGVWELVGVIFTIEVFAGQPSNAVVFGTQTAMVDLSFYRDAILAQTRPRPVPLPWLAAAGLALGLGTAGAMRLRGRERDAAGPAA